MKSRKKHSDGFKARVALDAIKGHKTINELATEYRLHPNQIGQWKKKLIEGSSEIFSRKKGRDSETHENEKDRLYQQIGKLKVEVDWLKKTAGFEK